MSLSQSEVDRFYAFASWMIDSREVDSLADCLREFEAEKAASREAIQEGLADVAAGRTRPIEEFEAELRAEFNLPPRVPAQ